jgi:hypothetical protein
MIILTEENTPLNIQTNFDILKEKRIMFSVFDCSLKDNYDFFFLPLIYLESHKTDIAILKLNNNLVYLPVNYKILIGERYYDKLENVSIFDCYSGIFSAICLNPINCYTLDFVKIEVVSILNDVIWFFPKIKNYNYVVYPIENKKSPKCILVANDIIRLPDELEKIDFF